MVSVTRSVGTPICLGPAWETSADEVPRDRGQNTTLLASMTHEGMDRTWRW